MSPQKRSRHASLGEVPMKKAVPRDCHGPTGLAMTRGSRWSAAVFLLPLSSRGAKRRGDPREVPTKEAAPGDCHGPNGPRNDRAFFADIPIPGTVQARLPRKAVANGSAGGDQRGGCMCLREQTLNASPLCRFSAYSFWTSKKSRSPKGRERIYGR